MKKNAVITIWKDAEAVSYAAAHFFTIACNRCIAEKGKFVVGLSGGNTPKLLYQLLASVEFSRNIPWNYVFLFWSDERFVPHSDEASNYRMVKENLLNHISIPEENIFPVPVNGTPKKSAKEYEATIKDFFQNKKPVIDLLLLGMGDDGHTASLFPGTDILKEKKRLVKEVWIEGKQTCLPDRQAFRISFTLPLINKAAQILFLVTGKEKTMMLSNVLHPKKIKPALPVQLVKPAKGNVFWIIDEAAAINQPLAGA